MRFLSSSAAAPGPAAPLAAVKFPAHSHLTSSLITAWGCCQCVTQPKVTAVRCRYIWGVYVAVTLSYLIRTSERKRPSSGDLLSPHAHWLVHLLISPEAHFYLLPSDGVNSTRVVTDKWSNGRWPRRSPPVKYSTVTTVISCSYMQDEFPSILK